MIKFIQIDNGLAILKWQDLDDAVELKKFIECCGVTLHYRNVSNPFDVFEEDKND